MRVAEIYASCSGESTFAGWPFVVVRLAGCSLRCTWCDTPKALTRQHTDREMTPLEIVKEVTEQHIRPRYALVTGGEPLLQKHTPMLLHHLCEWAGLLDGDEAGLVQLETSGALPIDEVPPGVGVVLDIKCPSSEESHRNLWKNLEVLSARLSRDELKFVVAHREDYEWARKVIRERDLEEEFTINISPVHGVLAPADLAKWMLEDRLNARLNLQLHKYVWGDNAEGV